MKEIAAVVLHFRTPEVTTRCLQSLVRAGVNRIIVVDNSEDFGASIAVVRDSLRPGFPLEIVDPGRNLGFSAGVTLGLEQLSAFDKPDVLLINSDAVIDRSSLRSMSAALQDAAVVVPLTQVEGDMTPISSIAHYVKSLGLLSTRPVIGSIPYPSGCCLLVRGNVACKALLDADFFFYGEDVDLGQRLADKKIGFLEAAGAVAIHARSTSARNGSLFYEYHMVRAHWALAEKLAKNGLQRATYISMRCVTLPARALIRSVRLRSMIPLQALMLATSDFVRGCWRPLTPSLHVQSSRLRH